MEVREMASKENVVKRGVVYPSSTVFHQAALRELEMKGLIEHRMLLL